MKYRLLGTNTKLAKCGPYGYLAAGLTLAPHSLSGNNVCPGSTVGCRASCVLWFSGRRVMQPIRDKAIRDTQLYFTFREKFLNLLRLDLQTHQKRAEKQGAKPLVRLNVASDLDWRDLIAEFPDIEFCDYTKVKSRMADYLAGKLPPNYSLTFSASELSHPSTLRSILTKGGNVSQVFSVEYAPQHGKLGSLPSTIRYHGRSFPVIDGDKHDIRLRHIDGEGVVVGLRLKGTNAAKSRAIHTQFSIPAMV